MEDVYVTGSLRCAIGCEHEECEGESYCFDEDDAQIQRLSKGATGVAYLPHQCNEWRIGGPSEIRALISDLEGALKTLEKE